MSQLKSNRCPHGVEIEMCEVHRERTVGDDVMDEIRKMEPVDDGGSAFPNPGFDNGPGNFRSYPSDGFSKREYIAVEAMKKFISSDFSPSELDHYDDVAKAAYRMADAMLKARRQK